MTRSVWSYEVLFRFVVSVKKDSLLLLFFRWLIPIIFQALLCLFFGHSDRVARKINIGKLLGIKIIWQLLNEICPKISGFAALR